MNTRRQFLITAAMGTVSVAACQRQQQATSSSAPPPTPGAPPAFGTAPGAGPEISPSTFAEAEKLVQVTMTDAERQTAAGNWRRMMAPLVERRVGPRKVALDPDVAPATRWDPRITGTSTGPAADRFVRSPDARIPLPSNDTDIAFAPVTSLSRWIESKALSSERLTNIYLTRIAQFDPKLRSVITLTRDAALAAAKRADAEIAAGKYRGPLHGIPYGVKDLLDTAGIATTYGAEPFRTRVPSTDSIVVRRLNDAGAVLVAKLSLGALALNDIWFGGQTMNPWLLEEGASGSSAGPGRGDRRRTRRLLDRQRNRRQHHRPGDALRRHRAAAHLRACPSHGCDDALLDARQARTDDADDRGLDAGARRDHRPRSRRRRECPVPSRLRRDRSTSGLRVGYFPAWMKESPATDVDRAALEALKKLGMTATAVSLPDWPYSSLMPVLFSEAAAAFEEITLSGADDTLKVQVPDAWPNLFRQSRFLSAVDFVQADRFRRRVALEMARIFTEVDVLLVPSLRDEMLTISNFTGHPSLTLRAGFVNVSEARSDWAPDPNNPLPKFSPARRVPHGVTLIGRLFDEGTIARAGLALERALGVVAERPPGF